MYFLYKQKCNDLLVKNNAKEISKLTKRQTDSIHARDVKKHADYLPKCNVSLSCYFFSEREHTRSCLLYVIIHPSIRPFVCSLSVTFVHPTQVIEIFGKFLCHRVPWPSNDIQVKFYGDRPR